MNLHAFVRNDPIGSLDHLGLACCNGKEYDSKVSCCIDNVVQAKVTDDAGERCCQNEMITIELRNEKGITQEESAKLIGITRNTLSMYERGERCPNIDIAVSAANAYNVSLDYLFGTGYKKQRNNECNMYEMGFSEEALDFLCSEENRYYVNAILSDPRIQKISDILYGSSYKPLINSYEMNYISRIISDLLYNILVK